MAPPCTVHLALLLFACVSTPGLGRHGALSSAAGAGPSRRSSLERQSPPGYPQAEAGSVRGELDFETEDVQRRNLSAGDFLLQFNGSGTATPHGSLVAQAVLQRPALATLPQEGVSQVLLTLEACALNQPHSHPRSTEFAFVLQGEVLFGFMEENRNAAAGSGGRLLSEPIPVGSSFVVPQGLIHFVMNRECTQARLIASFSNRDPGVQTSLPSIFNDQMPDDVLRAATGLSDDDINNIREKLAANPNPSADPECLKRCGLL